MGQIYSFLNVVFARTFGCLKIGFGTFVYNTFQINKSSYAGIFNTSITLSEKTTAPKIDSFAEIVAVEDVDIVNEMARLTEVCAVTEVIELNPVTIVSTVIEVNSKSNEYNDDDEDDDDEDDDDEDDDDEEFVSVELNTQPPNDHFISTYYYIYKIFNLRECSDNTSNIYKLLKYSDTIKTLHDIIKCLDECILVLKKDRSYFLIHGIDFDSDYLLSCHYNSFEQVKQKCQWSFYNHYKKLTNKNKTEPDGILLIKIRKMGYLIWEIKDKFREVLYLAHPQKP